MKQLLAFNPTFVPGAAGVGYLDFSGYPFFDIGKLYAVINTTRNTIIYAPGASGLGVTNVTGGVTGASTAAGATGLTPAIVTLSFDTSTHSSTDNLNVFYDTSIGALDFGAIGNEENITQETGGNLQKMVELQQAMLTELQTMNIILAQGLNINMDDLNQLRSDLTNPNTQEFRL
jgi:hypothetical protein